MSKVIYVAHGAISNSGDFLIFNRGWDLLKKFLSTDNIELVPVKRWEPITGQCDALIILGGPIISRSIHSQSAYIKKYLEKNKVPVICLGVGISGKDYSASEPFFADQESVDFWTAVYNSSQLLSVRDAYTREVLRNYNIPAVLTGCPALYDPEFISVEGTSNNFFEGDNHNLTITIPNINIFSVSSLIRTLFFLYYIKSKFANSGRLLHRRVVFQHGFHSFGNNTVAKIARLLDFETIDGSGKSINKITEISDSDIHIGTRLHMNIFFLSRSRLSYLLSVDNRTDAFLNTISTPSDSFTIGGIKRLVDECYDDLTNNRLQSKVASVRAQIMKLYPEMRDYLIQVKQFVNLEESNT
jgi:hypothetical protein